MRSGEKDENGEMKVMGNLELMVEGKRYYMDGLMLDYCRIEYVRIENTIDSIFKTIKS